MLIEGVFEERPVHINVDAAGNLLTTGYKGAFTDRSGTITLGNTRQAAAAANATRKYLLIQNPGIADLWFNFTTPAVIGSPSIYLPAKGSLIWEANFIPTEAIDIIGASTSQPYTIKEG